MNRILTFWIIAAIAGFCVAEPVTKTRLAALHPRDGLVVTDVDIDSVKESLSTEMSHFPYFDGTPNDMRVSPIKDIGGFCFVDKTSEGDEFGMSYHAWGDSSWGFALWDKTQFPSSSRAKPYFAVGPMGFTIPTESSDSWSGTIDWFKVWNGLSVSDDIFDSSNPNSRRSVSSRAINSFMYYELPRVVGRYVATGNVHSATGVLKSAGEIATYENIIEDAGYFAATSKVVKSVTFGEWTSSMTMEKDGVILNHMEYKDGKWHVYIDDDMVVKNYLLFSFEGDEDATDFSYTDSYGTITFARTKTVVTENRFGLATLDDIGGVSETIVTNIVRKVVNTAGRYVWDKDLEVCYRLNAAGGFLDLVAVTNVDVTLPENWAALEAIENEWSAK